MFTYVGIVVGGYSWLQCREFREHEPCQAFKMLPENPSRVSELSGRPFLLFLQLGVFFLGVFVTRALPILADPGSVFRVPDCWKLTVE